MTEERKGVRDKDAGKGAKDAKERRRTGLFAWLGPMLDRRTPRVEQLDEDDAEEPREKG